MTQFTSIRLPHKATWHFYRAWPSTDRCSLCQHKELVLGPISRPLCPASALHSATHFSDLLEVGSGCPQRPPSELSCLNLGWETGSLIEFSVCHFQGPWVKLSILSLYPPWARTPEGKGVGTKIQVPWTPSWKLVRIRTYVSWLRTGILYVPLHCTIHSFHVLSWKTEQKDITPTCWGSCHHYLGWVLPGGSQQGDSHCVISGWIQIQTYDRSLFPRCEVKWCWVIKITQIPPLTQNFKLPWD